jgi:hypothetical protein
MSADTNPESIQSVIIGDRMHTISFLKTVLIGDELKASIYKLKDDSFHELSIYWVKRGTRTATKTALAGRPLTVE